MTGRFASLRDRPIADGERRGALAAATVLLVAATVLLVLTRPGTRQPPPLRAPAAGAAARVSQPPPPAPAAASAGSLSPALARVCGGFLAGYLAYLYGHAPAGAVKDATGALARSLQAHPPRVPPAMLLRRPRVLALHAFPAPPGLVGVSALVNDDGLVDYRVGFLLSRSGGRLLVSGLEDQ